MMSEAYLKSRQRAEIENEFPQWLVRGEYRVHGMGQILGESEETRPSKRARKPGVKRHPILWGVRT